MSARFIKELDEFRLQLDELRNRGADLDWLRTERRVRLQYAITRVFAEATSIPEGAAGLLQSFCIIEGWHVGQLWQPEAGRELLQIQGTWHSPSLDASEFLIRSRRASYLRGSDLPGKVWMSGKPSWIAELRSDTSWELAPVAVRLGLHSLFAFPIRNRSEVTGVVVLLSREHRKPDPDLFEMADSLGRQIGDFIGRKRIESDIEARERRFRALIENSSDAIRLFNRNGKILYATPAAERILGYASGEFIGKDAAEFVHPDEALELRQLLARSTEKPGVPVVAEYRFRRKDGSWQWLESVATNLLSEPGVEAIVVNSRDITDRRSALEQEAQSRIREELARADAEKEQERLNFLTHTGKLLSNSLDYGSTLSNIVHLAVPSIADWCAVDMIEKDEILQRAAFIHKDPGKTGLGHKMGSLSALTSEPHGGKGDWLRSGKSRLISRVTEPMLASASLKARQLAALREMGLSALMMVPMIARGRQIGAITFALAEPDSSYDEQSMTVAEEFVRGAALTLDNIRLYQESQKLNAELERRVAERTGQLEMANQELEAFSYSISHDLRAPLRAIAGFSRLLLDEYTPRFDAEGGRLMNIVRDSALRMGQLIDDLLAFSRVGRRQLNRSKIDMTQLAASVYEEQRLTDPERNVQVSIHPLPPMRGDAPLIRQVFVNLISNALKFTDRGNHAVIEIGSKVETDETVYYVKDNGVGFDMHYQERLFGVFQRLHTAEEFEGTGVGLAIVKRIVTRHGGRVWAEAKPKEGATFYFSFSRPH